MQGLPGCASFSNTCLGVLHSLTHMQHVAGWVSFSNTCATCCFLITLHSQTRMLNSFITRKGFSEVQRFSLHRNFSDVLILKSSSRVPTPAGLLRSRSAKLLRGYLSGCAFQKKNTAGGGCAEAPALKCNNPKRQVAGNDMHPSELAPLNSPC